MTRRALMLSCGFFPDHMLPLLDQEAAECFIGLKYGDAPARVVCDFPVYELRFSWCGTVPDELVGWPFWADFSSDLDYYAALIRPGDEVHAFCFPRDPAHRDLLALMNRVCAACGAVHRLHLF